MAKKFKIDSKLRTCFIYTFLAATFLLLIPKIFTNITVFQDYCADHGEIFHDFPDFFYFIAFAKTMMISNFPYSESNILLAKYLCINHESITLPFSYPPNAIILISHLPFLEELLGFKNLVVFIFAMNALILLSTGYLLKKITKLNLLLILLVLFSSQISMLAFISGQFSIILSLFLSLSIYFYLNNRLFLAGFFLSILVIKPTLCILLLPFCMVRKKLFLGVLSGFALTILYPILLKGKTIFIDYFNQFFVNQDKDVFIYAKQSIALPSILLKNNLLNDNLEIMKVQVVFATIIILISILVFLKDNELKIESKLGLLILLNMLATPYSLAYDYLLTLPALFLLAMQFSKDKIFLVLSFGMLYTSNFLVNPTTDIWLLLFILCSYIVSQKTSIFKG